MYRAAGFADELLVELSDILLAQEAVGVLYLRDSGWPQYLRQEDLPSSKTELAASAGLGRIGSITSEAGWSVTLIGSGITATGLL